MFSEAPTTDVGRVTPSAARAHPSPMLSPVAHLPYPPNDMETIDIARLKFGEVNLGVRFYVVVGYPEGELIIASGYRPRS